MYDSDPHVYMSLTNINETNLPVATLPVIMSSTVSSTSILETLGASIPLALLRTPAVEVPVLTLQP